MVVNTDYDTGDAEPRDGDICSDFVFDLCKRMDWVRGTNDGLGDHLPYPPYDLREEVAVLRIRDVRSEQTLLFGDVDD